MDLDKILSELKQRLRHVNEAIATVEALQKNRETMPVRRKRGRPPKNAQPNPNQGRTE